MVYDAYKRWRTPIPKILAKKRTSRLQARLDRIASRIATLSRISVIQAASAAGSEIKKSNISTGMQHVPHLRMPQTNIRHSRYKRDKSLKSYASNASSRRRSGYYSRMSETAAADRDPTVSTSSTAPSGEPEPEHDKEKDEGPGADDGGEKEYNEEIEDPESYHQQRGRIQDMFDFYKEMVYLRAKLDSRKPFFMKESIEKRDKEVAHLLLMRDLQEERLRKERKKKAVALMRQIEERESLLGPSTSFRSFESSTEAERHLYIYQWKWDLFAKPTEYLPTIVAFVDMPWPVLGTIQSGEDITFTRVRDFALHPRRPLLGDSLKATLQLDMEQWSQRHFAKYVVPRLAEHDIAPAMACASSISEWLEIIVDGLGDYDYA